ncbi:MAG: helix-turn-helix domain-containing protein [Lachnospiraceae bacterium]|nr:helix-turn-helix domain-containing protein [Lachnospiraceae bacterium]
MYKNKAPNGSNNICGIKIKQLRKSLPQKTSQKQLSDMLTLQGLDLDKNAIQRIESGERFVTDIELRIIARTFHISCDELLQEECLD